MLKFLIGATLAALMIGAGPAANAAGPSHVVHVALPHWGNTDVMPMSDALEFGWTKVVVRRFCRKTVIRVWERHGKGHYSHLISKRVLTHHKPVAGCGRRHRS